MAALHTLSVSPTASFSTLDKSTTSRDRANAVVRSDFFGAHRPTLRIAAPNAAPAFARPHKVEAAISRSKKESTVEKAKEQLKECCLLAAINYKSLTVKQLQDLRARLPSSVSMVIMKNNLLGKAVEGTAFASIHPALSGMNAFLFVHSEEIPLALKPFRDVQKELKLESNDFTGAVFEGRFYPPSDMNALETLPSRADVYSKLLGVIQTPARNVVTTLQAPARELVLTLRARVEQLEAAEGGSSSS